MPTCKGRWNDGTPCSSPVDLGTGYCQAHQQQAHQPYRWTRERLEVAIAAHGGSDGLDLRAGDFSKLDLRGAELQGAKLVGANLQGAKLVDANLQGAQAGHASLRGADLRGAILRETKLGEADLREANLWHANLQGADLTGANLQGATPGYANLQDADLRYANLQGAALLSANLQGADLGGANLQGANLGGANLQGASLLDANLQGAGLLDANLRSGDLRELDFRDVLESGLLAVRLYRANLDRTLLKSEQLGPAIGDELDGKYREARDAYLALKQNFAALGEYEAASWSYIKERQMEKVCSAPWRARRFYGREQLGETYWHRRLPAYHPRLCWFFLRHTASWVGGWGVELMCKYGESVGRVLFWMLFALLGFATYYWHIGGVWLVQPNSVKVAATSFWHYLLYSAGAFTTTSFETLQAADDRVRLVTALQAIVGIFLAGLLGFVAGNRIRRS